MGEEMCELLSYSEGQVAWRILHPWVSSAQHGASLGAPMFRLMRRPRSCYPGKAELP